MTPDEPTEADDRGGRLVGALYVLAVLGGLLGSGMLIPGVSLGHVDEHVAAGRPFTVPATVYLYAYVGAMAHVAIRFVDDRRPDAPTLVALALRVPAALLVVVGIYLLGSTVELGSLVDAVLPMLSSEGRYEQAFTAYLVGLFVDRALGALDTTSARLYPGDPSELRL